MARRADVDRFEGRVAAAGFSEVELVLPATSL
jgi:hypothetical protein